MMKNASKGGLHRRTFFFIATLLLLAGFLFGVFFFIPTSWIQLDHGWKKLTREGRRILGWKTREILPEEKRIREEVILKKMEEASIQQDWRSLAPEYPRPNKLEGATEEERIQALKNSREFNEIEKALMEYLKEREELLIPEPPIPSVNDVVDLPQVKDRGSEKVVERLLNSQEKSAPEKPLEENLRLGMKGPLASRKILVRPNPPSVNVKVEVEIELTLWVLPNGTVDRVVPSVKGDSEMERSAIQYLKQWRFIPISKDEPEVEQWGTIPIKFRLQ